MEHRPLWLVINKSTNDVVAVTTDFCTAEVERDQRQDNEGVEFEVVYVEQPLPAPRLATY